MSKFTPLYYYTGDYLSAIKYYQETLNLKDELGDKEGISINLKVLPRI